MSFEDRVDRYTARVDAYLANALPAQGTPPQRLHDAMRYAVFNGGKRIRPLLVYATAETLGIDADATDPLAASIELIHAFSLVHDDLPAMDDDDLRRGKPTVHKAYDEATAILAADALQPRAFELLAAAGSVSAHPSRWLECVVLLARAAGSLGMTGGQAIDISAEGRQLASDELDQMHSMKTGCLIAVAIEGVMALAEPLPSARHRGLGRFAKAIGLAFQVRDDILDIEGETSVIGKQQGADADRGKATWPLLFGMDAAKQRCEALRTDAFAALDAFGTAADPLRTLAALIIDRDH
ncbi:MAG: polyprenyl synthetase family protein [Pseudomonadota bacterium]